MPKNSPTTTKYYRMRSHAGRWADLWERLEDCGIPVDSGQAADWARRYNASRAYLLVNELDRLQEMKLPLEAVTLIASAIMDAFKLGQESDGRID